MTTSDYIAIAAIIVPVAVTVIGTAVGVTLVLVRKLTHIEDKVAEHDKADAELKQSVKDLNAKIDRLLDALNQRFDNLILTLNGKN